MDSGTAYLKAKDSRSCPSFGVVDDEEIEALKRNIQGMIQEALACLPQVPPEVRMAVMSQDNPVQLAYFLASVLDLGVETEQKMLEVQHRRRPADADARCSAREARDHADPLEDRHRSADTRWTNRSAITFCASR